MGIVLLDIAMIMEISIPPNSVINSYSAPYPTPPLANITIIGLKTKIEPHLNLEI